MGAAALPVPVRPHAAARRRGARHRRAVLRPLAAARVGAAACAACAAGATATASSPASTTSAPQAPDAAFRSNFIVGYPGETEADHDQLLAFVDAAQLDWCGFFAYSREDGTYAADLDGAVPRPLVDERLAELRERQDAITAARRDDLVGTEVEVLVDAPGVARSHREAPEIDGIVAVPDDLAVGHVPHACASPAPKAPTPTPSRSSWRDDELRAVRPLGAGHAGQPRHDLAARCSPCRSSG